jgi:hypothetical protein
LKIRLFDRSRVVEDWKCSRSRYWRYEYGGRGIVPNGNALELFLGTTVHDGLAAIAAHVNIEEIAAVARKQVFDALTSEYDDWEAVYFANEQASLVEGLLRGFHKVVWPRLMAAYPHIVAIEQEMVYTVADDLIFMSKPDLVLANDDREHVYVEYKTTSSKKSEWVNSWNTAVQVHSTIKAIKETLGVDCTHVIVQGLYKGSESYGKQNSPLCYAYARTANPPFTSGDLRYDYAAGYKKKGVWELEGGVKKWIEEMPESTLSEQFPATPPIYINEELVEAFFAQRKVREQEIAAASHTDEASMTRIFPQKFDQCVQAWGRPCAFRNLCFGYVEDPLNQGYVWRQPHHTPEMEQHEQQLGGKDSEAAVSREDSLGGPSGVVGEVPEAHTGTPGTGEEGEGK